METLSLLLDYNLGQVNWTCPTFMLIVVSNSVLDIEMVLLSKENRASFTSDAENG